jgi:tripartite-type tricarboxylate transporter receptor subunit TctC
VAPAGTPPAVIERLSKALADIGAEADTKERLGQLGMEPARIGPPEFGRLIHSELTRYGRLVRDGRITVE